MDVTSSQTAEGEEMNGAKFRAWHRRLKEWACVLELHYDTHGTQYEAVLFSNRVKGPVLLGCNKYDLVEFTGLKDKNGKEIYEGDIVTGNTDSEGEPYLSVVKWSTTPYTAHFDFGLAPACHLAEVIGNIYENPDLLEEGKA